MQKDLFSVLTWIFFLANTAGVFILLELVLWKKPFISVFFGIFALATYFNLRLLKKNKVR